MAVRYSGDIEVRIVWKGRAYDVRVRGPRIRGGGSMTLAELGLARKAQQNPSSSEAYDEAVRRIIEGLEDSHGSLPISRDSQGEILVARVFVSPCPQRSP